MTPAAKAALIAATELGRTWLRLSRRVPSISRANRRTSDIRFGFGAFELELFFDEEEEEEKEEEDGGMASPTGRERESGTQRVIISYTLQ